MEYRVAWSKHQAIKRLLYQGLSYRVLLFVQPKSNAHYFNKTGICEMLIFVLLQDLLSLG